MSENEKVNGTAMSESQENALLVANRKFARQSIKAARMVNLIPQCLGNLK